MFKVLKKHNPFNYIEPYFDSLISIIFKNTGSWGQGWETGKGGMGHKIQELGSFYSTPGYS